MKLVLFSGGVLAGAAVMFAVQASWLTNVFGDMERFTKCRGVHGTLRAMADYYEHKYARPSFQEQDIWD